jgi:SpoVK/Ycf46/Vps4 family AAA+-type ATPase
MLLPRRVVGYAFRERRFVMLDINSLRDPPASDNVFQNLKIDEAHKLMVTSLVKSHLDKQKTQKLRSGVSLNQDLIRGKGSGLVMLLHGVPGVGKTATAEAVAQANKKPLFVITCGDLGFTPGEVENSLKDIFRLAHSWDCILLLDEADIFLSRRQLSDLKRNALVSGKEMPFVSHR